MKLSHFVLTVGAFALIAAQQMIAEEPHAPIQHERPADSPANDDVVNEPTDPEQKASFWMDQKLRLSKDILAGLAMADFDQMGRSAERMHGLNRIERFVRRSPEGYRDHLRQFNMANNAIRKACRDENLEAATLAFNQLTVSCVNCHQHLRSQALE